MLYKSPDFCTMLSEQYKSHLCNLQQNLFPFISVTYEQQKILMKVMQDYSHSIIRIYNNLLLWECHEYQVENLSKSSLE